MEELKLLVEMVASLPEMALWVIVMFFAYKTLIVGSVYGLIRFVVMKLHDWAIAKKGAGSVKLSNKFDNLCIGGNESDLAVQLERCKRHTGIYLHGSDVDWLRAAIDLKILSETTKGSN